MKFSVFVSAACAALTVAFATPPNLNPRFIEPNDNGGPGIGQGPGCPQPPGAAPRLECQPSESRPVNLDAIREAAAQLRTQRDDMCTLPPGFRKCKAIACVRGARIVLCNDDPNVEVRQKCCYLANLAQDIAFACKDKYTNNESKAQAFGQGPRNGWNIIVKAEPWNTQNNCEGTGFP